MESKESIFKCETEEQFEKLKILKKTLFPLQNDSKLKRLADFLVVFENKLIGFLTSVLVKEKSQNVVVITAIGLLRLYRRKGHGNALLAQLAKDLKKISFDGLIRIHVKLNDIGVASFYMRNGFRKIRIIRNYYKRLDCNDCIVMEKIIN